MLLPLDEVAYRSEVCEQGGLELLDGMRSPSGRSKETSSERIGSPLLGEPDVYTTSVSSRWRSRRNRTSDTQFR